MDANTPSSSPSNAGCILNTCEPAGFAGAFFPQSRHLRIIGGTFTSQVCVQNTPHENFKWIGRGEIDLQREIRLNNHLAMTSGKAGATVVRRMFSAKIREGTERSVILFEGENAEEDRRQYISRHTNLWHPNILQIFGLSDILGKYAVIAHDDLIPYRDYLDLHQPSTTLLIYLLALWGSEFQNVEEQFGSGLDAHETRWIRRSTGRLCIDLELSHWHGMPLAYSYYRALERPPSKQVDWNDSTWETKALEALSISDFHYIGSVNCGKTHYIHIEPGQEVDVRAGAVSFIPKPPSSRLEYVEIAFLPDVHLECRPWGAYRVCATVTDEGWTCFNSEEIYGNSASLCWRADMPTVDMWMAQANHIFKRLDIISGYDSYVLICGLHLLANIGEPAPRSTPSLGYLFLRPPKDFLTSSNSFRWPQCPWFWSFDSCGRVPLNTEEARSHGFPEVQMQMTIWGESWDANFYKELRTLHAFAGFDPESPELAVHLGQPSFQVSSEKEELFAHVCELQVQPEVQAGIAEKPPQGITLDEWANPEGSRETSVAQESVVAPDALVPNRKISSWVQSFWDWETPEFGSLC